MKFTKNEISFYVLVLGIFFALSFYLYKFHYSVINSTAFSSFVMLLVGSIAIFLYLKQKSDAKVQAARVLLLEIRTAEERINQIKDMIEGSSSEDLPTVFTTNSWKTYSHLFVSDFDQDELKLVGAFYDYAALIGDFAKRNNDFFWITTEERARIVQQKLAELVVSDVLPVERNKRLDDISSDGYSYTPNKTIKEIKKYTEKIVSITTTSAGIKLKYLAKM